MKMISENEKRERRARAERARRRQQLEARGFSADDAVEVVRAVEEARTLAQSAAIGAGIGANADDVAETERLAVAAVKRAAEIVAKVEPSRAARLRPVLAEIDRAIELSRVTRKS